MFGIKPKMMQQLTGIIRDTLFNRSFGPAVFAAGVFKLQGTAVLKKKHSLIKGCVDYISRRLPLHHLRLRFHRGILPASGKD